MAGLTDDSKKRIEHYVKKKYISDSIFVSLWKSRTKNELISVLKYHLTINEITNPKIWSYIVNSIWTDLDSIFDRGEIILLKEILKNDGVAVRTKVCQDCLNQYMTTKSIQTLEQREIIDVLTMTTNEKLVIIHPRFRKEVFTDGSTSQSTE